MVAWYRSSSARRTARPGLFQYQLEQLSVVLSPHAEIVVRHIDMGATHLFRTSISATIRSVIFSWLDPRTTLSRSYNRRHHGFRSAGQPPREPATFAEASGGRRGMVYRQFFIFCFPVSCNRPRPCKGNAINCGKSLTPFSIAWTSSESLLPLAAHDAIYAGL